ncbi:UNVERIFIED_CONTAM: hypothetical protein FKN15_025050 [Acipenser sinensis]
MAGKSYARGMRAHKLTLQAMWRIVISQLLNYIENENHNLKEEIEDKSDINDLEDLLSLLATKEFRDVMEAFVALWSFRNHNRGTDCFTTSPDIPSVMSPSVASAIGLPPICDCHIADRIKVMTSGVVTPLPFWMVDFQLSLE